MADLMNEQEQENQQIVIGEAEEDEDLAQMEAEIAASKAVIAQNLKAQQSNQNASATQAEKSKIVGSSSVQKSTIEQMNDLMNQ